MTPVGTVPCSDQVTPDPDDRLMTLLPFAAPGVPPPNVDADTAVADRPVSCQVVALAGSAAAPTARALNSSTGTAIPSAPLRLKCMASRLSVFAL